MRISTSEFLLGSLADMMNQESNVNALNQQIASGQTMQSALDNPAGAGAALSLQGQINHLSVDSANAQSGVQSIENSLGSLQSVSTILAQIKTTAIQAANGTISDDDRHALAATVQSALQQLVQVGNTQSSDGQYLFGGSRTASAPFAIQPSGQVVFTGDGGASSLEIAPSLAVPVTLSGQGIFMNIPGGNGSFSVAASGSNTGHAYAVAGGVTSASQLQAEQLAGTQFVVTFGAASPNGSMAYSVTSGTGSPGAAGFTASSGIVASGSFAPGAGLTIGGMDVGINGTPAAGDSFVVAPSQNVSVFQILQSLQTTLAMPGGATSAISQQQIQNVLAELESAQTSVLGAQATLGGNLSNIQSVQAQDTATSTQAQAQLSGLQSANLPQVLTNYNEGIVSLQASEQAFARIQNLSLFSVIGP
ncbi:MAG TPA: flagellar hook-associated protein FlgL [Stellaceae bacterium]